MYNLTLTSSERKAFDFNGYRYFWGDDAQSILIECMGPDDEWDNDDDITFIIPEHMAWELNEHWDREDFGCVSDNLIGKIYDELLSHIG